MQLNIGYSRLNTSESIVVTKSSDDCMDTTIVLLGHRTDLRGRSILIDLLVNEEFFEPYPILRYPYGMFESRPATDTKDYSRNINLIISSTEGNVFTRDYCSDGQYTGLGSLTFNHYVRDGESKECITELKIIPINYADVTRCQQYITNGDVLINRAIDNEKAESFFSIPESLEELDSRATAMTLATLYHQVGMNTHNLDWINYW